MLPKGQGAVLRQSHSGTSFVGPKAPPNTAICFVRAIDDKDIPPVGFTYSWIVEPGIHTIQLNALYHPEFSQWFADVTVELVAGHSYVALFRLGSERAFEIVDETAGDVVVKRVPVKQGSSTQKK